ncbi:MAG: DUF5681 domain-containing protein [Terriglobia bacterium]
MNAPQNRRKTGGPVPNGGATRFRPGQSGNPGGRPKSAPLSHACRELLAALIPEDPQHRTYAEAIAQTLAQKAIAGDVRAAQEITDRAEGRARQSVEFQDVTLRDAFEKMSGEELETYAREGKLPEWFPVSEQNGRRMNGYTLQIFPSAPSNREPRPAC